MIFLAGTWKLGHGSVKFRRYKKLEAIFKVPNLFFPGNFGGDCRFLVVLSDKTSIYSLKCPLLCRKPEELMLLCDFLEVPFRKELLGAPTVSTQD